MFYKKQIFTTKPERKPAETGHLITLSGAVMIHTADGNIVMTPRFALEIARLLPTAAAEAEAHIAPIGLSG